MQPFDYLTSTGGIIWTAVCVLSGVILTWLYYRIINRIPATWLCDYNETPSAELLSGDRVRYTRSGIIMSVVTAASFVLCRLQFNKGYDIYFIVFSLMIVVSLMIAICDIKYTIIPDQFTIALGVLALAISIYDIVRGYGLLHTSWWSPLAGAAIGAGVMLFIDLIGMIIYKRTGMGFGDVKLFAAVGLAAGFPGTILSFIISMISAMVCFVVIIIVVRVIAGKSATSVDSDVSDPKTDPSSENIAVKAASHGVQASPEAALHEETSSGNADNALLSDDENGEKSGEENGQEESSGSYLAFGPYIALSLICYFCFYDFIYNLVEMYLKLF